MTISGCLCGKERGNMQEKEINLIDYWNIIWKKRKFIIITVTIVTVLSGIISLLLPKWYKATAVIMPPTESRTISGLSGLPGVFGLGNILGAAGGQARFLAILKSRTLLESVNKKFDFQTRYKSESLEQAIITLQNNMNVKTGDEDQIIVSFLDRDQDQVANITNYIVHCLDSLNIALYSGKARSNREFLENRIKIVKDSLVTIELKLKREVLSPISPEVEFLEKEIETLKDKFNEYISQF